MPILTQLYFQYRYFTQNMCNGYATIDGFLELVNGKNITLFWDVVPCSVV
jgi:hypothetical protein